MIVLLILMLLLLAPALWAYIYIWRGLNRRVIAAVKVVDPIITLGPYAMGAWAALSACVAVNIWCEGPARLIGNIITLTIAVGCALWAGFWLLMHCLGGQTPGKRPTWWREAVAAKFAWRNLESMPAYLGARTSILPVANPRIVKPYSGSWTRPIGATMEGYLPDGSHTEGFDEHGRKMPRIYPVGPEPTAFEVARWGKTVSSDLLLHTFLPTAPFERLRMAGTITGPFTFAGAVPHGAVTKWPRRSGANRAFGNYARLGEITQRRVELLVDYRLVAALQTTRESYERRHSWVLAFTDITADDLTFDTSDDGKLQIVFGQVGEDYPTPWVFTATVNDTPRLRRKIMHAMRERKILKQTSAELMDWHFRPKLSEFPHGPIQNELPEEFYFKSNRLIVSHRETSAKGEGEAH